MTIGAFAMLVGADRRTITRRLIANSIEPVGKNGQWDVYRIEDLRRTIQDAPKQDRNGCDLENDEACAESIDESELCHLDDPVWNASVGARDGAIYSVGDALPGALSNILDRLSLSEPERDKLTLDIFKALATGIEARIRSYYLGYSLLELLESDPVIEWPEGLQPIVSRLHPEKARDYSHAEMARAKSAKP